MEVCDFQRSFMTFRIDSLKQKPITHSHKAAMTLNNARIVLDCRCVIRRDGESVEYLLGASCKTERCYVEEDIWTEPNADFCPIVSSQEMLLIKRWDRTDKGVMLYPPSLGEQPERQVGPTAEAWDRLALQVQMVDAELLDDTAAVIDATFAGRPLVSRTEYTSPDGAEIMIEYPIKTINVNERDTMYQVDTGPLLYPQPVPAGELQIAGLRLAYIAHNAPDWAELIINVPTPVSDDISVHHYSKAQRLDGVRNTMFAIS